MLGRGKGAFMTNGNALLLKEAELADDWNSSHVGGPATHPSGLSKNSPTLAMIREDYLTHIMIWQNLYLFPKSGELNW